MEVKHLEPRDFDRVRRGVASIDETERVGQHVGKCAECAALASRALSVVDSTAALDAAFTIDTQPRSRRPLALWFAAAAATIAALALLIPRTEDAPKRGGGLQPAAPRSIENRHQPIEHPLLTETRRTSTLPFPADLRALAAPDTFRGEPSRTAATRLTPSATAIADTHPELHWPLTAGATYVVIITSEGNEIAQSEPLTEARWRVPVALQRGRMYRWQVVVNDALVIPAPPAPPAIFRVLSAREHDTLVREIKDASDDRLLRGLLYARVGMATEARRELEAYERETRDPLARRLLAQLP